MFPWFEDPAPPVDKNAEELRILLCLFTPLSLIIWAIMYCRICCSRERQLEEDEHLY